MINSETRACLESLEARKLLAAGDLDPTFGSRGVIPLDLPAAAQPRDLDHDSGGKFLLTAGHAIRRFNPDGSLDISFADNGVLDPVFIPPTSVAVQPDGKILVTGPLDIQWAVARYNPDGSPDNSFGNNGLATAQIGGTGWESASLVARAPDGKILLAGLAERGDHDPAILVEHAAIARFNANGTVDTSFDGDGEWISGVPDIMLLVHDFAVAPDGRMLLAGEAFQHFGAPPRDERDASYIELGPSAQRLSGARMERDHDLHSQFLSAGYRPDGTPVLGERFAADAFVHFNLGRPNAIRTDVYYDPVDARFNNHKVTTLLTQSDNKVIALGYGGSLKGGSGVMRFNPDGTPDPTFGFGGSAVFNIKKRKADWISHAALNPDGDILAVGQIGGNPIDLSGTGRYFLTKIQGGARPTGTRTPVAGVSPINIFPPQPQSQRDTYAFDVAYAADGADIDLTSLNNRDLIVRGPRGFVARATFVRTAELRHDGARALAIYNFAPPGGTWDPGDSGTYVVSVRKRQVRDTSGNFVRAAPIGTLRISVPNNLPEGTVTSARPATPFAAAPKIRRSNDILHDSDTLC
jgi:uncharacterized delta-60 repeat protein